MFNLVLAFIAQTWREALFVSEYTGLSIGLLVALAVLVYFDPLLRTVAIRIGIAIILAYCVLMYGHHAGVVEVQAAWDAANAQAAKQSKQRDLNEAKAAGADAAEQTTDLQGQQKSDQEQIDALRKADADCHPITGDQLR